nr:hypothetical protein [Tanacetum cinerariifolium]
MQTQTSNTLHNAIMEAGSKDRLPMLAPGNYIQWKSRIKRYIDIKPNRELIHYCLENRPYELGWKEKPIFDAEGNPTNSTDRVFETYKNVKQEIRDQLNAEAEAVQIILTGIDNDIYSTVNACLNACEMWKAIERLKQGFLDNSEKKKKKKERVSNVLDDVTLILGGIVMRVKNIDGKTSVPKSILKKAARTMVGDSQESAMTTNDGGSASKGRISFARALIEIDAAVGLKKEVIMAIPDEEGDDYIKEVVRVEYEWKPPHCVDCKSFGHDTALCPKRVREEVPKNSARDTKTTVMEENDDGVTEVKSRKKNKGANFGVSNPGLNTSNPFDVLNVDGDDMGESGIQPK